MNILVLGLLTAMFTYLGWEKDSGWSFFAAILCLFTLFDLVGKN